jgi:hypothetical protein
MLISRRILGVLLVSLLFLGTALATASLAEEKRFPWQKAPGPIAGRWSLTCEERAGMVIEVSVIGKRATGKVLHLDKAGAFGYSVGEEILRLEADDFGDWVGQLHWRAQYSKDRWDPIHFVANSMQLDAIMTTDRCYKNMPRAD